MSIVFETEFKRLNTPDSYFPMIAIELAKKRDFMIKFLRSVGMKPVVPQGGYFLIADWSALGNEHCILFTHIYSHFRHLPFSLRF